jgi:hypothetical protein
MIKPIGTKKSVPKYLLGPNKEGLKVAPCSLNLAEHAKTIRNVVERGTPPVTFLNALVWLYHSEAYGKSENT